MTARYGAAPPAVKGAQDGPLWGEDPPASGVYVIQVELGRPLPMQVGSRAALTLDPGSYLYVGRARRALPARLARHCRRDKRLRWHVDHLTLAGRVVAAWVWALATIEECSLARELSRCLPVVPGFGASDCRCAGHLLRGAARDVSTLPVWGLACWRGER